MARPGLREHPKFRVLCRLLNAPDPHVWGYLEMLWSTAYQNGDDLIGGSDTVEAVCHWPGERGVLTKALLECGQPSRKGFIEEDPQQEGSYLIHDLFENAPEYVQVRRQKESERKIVKICQNCGCEYHSTEKHSKYCTASCRVMYHRKGSTDVNGGLRNVNGQLTHCNGQLTHCNGQLTEVNAPTAPAPAPAPNVSSKEETKAFFLPKPFDTNHAKAVFQKWFAYLDTKNRAPADRLLAAYAACGFFKSVCELERNINHAIANDWTSLRNYGVGESNPGDHDASKPLQPAVKYLDSPRNQEPQDATR